MKNPEMRNAWIGVGITLLGFVLLAVPFFVEMDMMNGGFALMFFAFALIIPIGIITAVLYFLRARKLQKVLSGNDLLAHWTYSPEEWKRYAEEEYGREKSAKMGLFYVLVVISIIVGLGFLLIAEDKESGLLVVGVLAVLIIFIRILFYATTRNAYKTNKKFLGEAFIGRNGVYLNKSFHSWNFLVRFDNAGIDSQNKLLEIEYSTPSRQGRTTYTVRVPIPRGKEAEAETVATALLAGKKN